MQPNRFSQLGLYYQNVRGLRTKTHDVLNSSYSSLYDIVLFTEIWLSDSFSNNELFSPHYNVFRCDRDFRVTGRSLGGGVLIAVANSFTCITLDTTMFKERIPLVDLLILRITWSIKQLYIILIYIPPDLDIASFDELFDMLEIFILDKPVLIVGDFNLPNFVDHSNTDAKLNCFLSFVSSLNLKQYNHILNSNDRLLDLVLSNSGQTFEIDHDPLPMIPEDVYHPALSIELSCNLSPDSPSFPSNDNKRYNFHRANYVKLYSDLVLIDWSFLSGYADVNEAVHAFYKKIYSILDISIPITITRKSMFYPPWFTPDIKRNLKTKQHYHRKWKSTGSDYFKHEFQRLRRSVKAEISAAYSAYNKKIQHDLFTDPRSFWNYVRSKKSSSRIPAKLNDSSNEYSSPPDIVNAFAATFSNAFTPKNPTSSLPDSQSNNSLIYISGFSIDEVMQSIKRLKNKFTAGNDNIPCFFVRDCAQVFAEPLRVIFNLALRTCTFPDAWKMARICPVFKKGDNTDLSNYRPIAIIPAFAKVFESLICKHIAFYTKSSISPYQHGFMARRSTITNLSIMSQAIAEALDEGAQLDVIYTDFSRAFDSIDHSILLHKLSLFGFNNALLRLFDSYLTNRFNYVYYNGFKSYFYISTSGVPQGSNLGPLLFNLFIDDLVNSMQCQVLAYADDLKIYHKVTTLSDVNFLQHNLNHISTWCSQNGLGLNINKCSFVSYTKKLNKVDSQYCIDDVFIANKSSVKDLGVTYDSKFMFAEHISAITTTAFKTLGFIIRSCKDFNNMETMCSLFHALIVSKLEYAVMAWFPIYDVHINAVERVQRKFLKYLSYRQDGFYPTRNTNYIELLRRHGFESLAVRRQKISGSFMENLISGTIDAPDLLAKVNILVPRLESRTSNLVMIATPRTNVLLKAPLHHSARNFNYHY